MSFIIDVHDLSIFSDKTCLVEGFSLKLALGQVIGIVGESGSGKTLITQALMGILSKKYHTRYSDFKTQDFILGKEKTYVFQNAMDIFNPVLRIQKQLEEGFLYHFPNERAYVEEHTKEILRDVGLSPYLLNHYPHQLSGGQKQRFLLAMAIMTRPKLLIADEPTTAIDAQSQLNIWRLLRRIASQGTGVIVTTHQLNLAINICDEFIMIHKGKTIEKGSPSEILASPHPYIQELIKPYPRIHQGDPYDPIGIQEPAVLKVVGLSPVYGSIKDISFVIHKGQTLGMMGPSGIGKTSLAKSILRLIPSTGTIYLKGIPIHHLSMQKMRPFFQNIQYLFQDPFGSINPRYRGYDVIAEGIKNYLPRTLINEKVLEILDQMELSKDILTRPVLELSGGERQRLCLARHLVIKPDLLVLDEPTASLDYNTQRSILKLLITFQEKEKLSFFIISHDQKVIEALAHDCLLV